MFAVAVVLLNALTFASLAYVANRQQGSEGVVSLAKRSKTQTRNVPCSRWQTRG